MAAALGEALPLADGALSGVVSLDVIEHVDRPDAFLNEIDRVTRPGGRLALSTPNRFSLAPEPHVMVWGVGLLPRRYQARYVAWRSGKALPHGQRRASSNIEALHALRLQDHHSPRPGGRSETVFLHQGEARSPLQPHFRRRRLAYDLPADRPLLQDHRRQNAKRVRLSPLVRRDRQLAAYASHPVQAGELAAFPPGPRPAPVTLVDHFRGACVVFIRPWSCT